jgi:heme/copper-type cytochrome/quinol oxidase subunit 2
MKKYLVKLGGAGAFLAPVMAMAQAALPNSPITNPQSAITVLCTIAGWMFIFLIVLAIIFVIFAAFKYLTAGGDPEAVKTASNMLIYAAVAVAVALVAKGVPLFVAGILGGTVAAQC